MMNPDREELVKIADELDGWHDCADGDVSTGNGHFRVVCESDSEQQRLNLRATLREASTALRRLASSDSGAQTAPTLHEASIVAGRLRGLGVKRWREYGELEHKDVLEAMRMVWPSTAPPADAGMREALDNSQSLLVMVNHIGPKPELWETEEMSTLLVEQIMENRKALTAPGATTKSDGGEVITAEQMDAIEKAAVAGRPLADPFADKVPCHCHDAVSVRLCLDRDRCYTVEAQASPSDPSSTRSDVTVLTKRLDQVLKVMRGARNRSEPMAVWADDIKAVEDARALLDQFEIRRK
jgi:hypothetical protein